MEVPIREIDEFAWQVRLVGKGCGETIGERRLARGNPDLPIHARRAECKMITGDATDMGWANDDGALKVPGEMCIGITEEQRGYVQVNVGFPAYSRKHAVEGIRGLDRREYLLTRSYGRDRLAIIKKVKGGAVPIIRSTDFVRSLNCQSAFGYHCDELSCRARSLQNAIRPEGESLGVGEGCAHTL